MEQGEPRPINGFLMLGLLATPLIFVWFLFLPGYARSTRRAALAWAFLLPILSLTVTLLTGKAYP